MFANAPQLFHQIPLHHFFDVIALKRKSVFDAYHRPYDNGLIARFLQHFAQRGLAGRFAGFNMAFGKRPDFFAFHVFDLDQQYFAPVQYHTAARKFGNNHNAFSK